MSNDLLKIIPLGGLGEVGKNMMALEYSRQILVVDAGLMFPENDMLGIDLVIPDFGYLRDKADWVQGIIVTHGHEDHTGALPYVLQHIHAPIYATKLTRGLIEVKLGEHHLLESTKLHTIRPGDKITLGPFSVEFFHVCHSIPDGVGLAIQTPVGLVVHSGDFKLDHTPVDGQPPDFAKLAELGGRGVLALLSDSTNVERPGTTPSERVIDAAFDQVFQSAQGRIIVATFASLVSRIQQVINCAVRHGRRVAIAGRTMVQNVRMAEQLGYLEIPPDMLVSLDQIARLSPAETVIIATGTQGEPTSALARMATGEHRQLKITRGDTVIISAHAIPGNEEMVNRIINRLFQRGADVVYEEIAPVHVSGHASQEEQKLLINLIRPQYFIPIHGELRHLTLHARLAQQLGIPADHTMVVENGYVLEFDGQEGRIGERVPGGYVFVDGAGVGDVGPAVLRDREMLARDGFVIAVVRRDERTGQVIGAPEIISRGFVFLRDAEDLLARAREQVVKTLSTQKRRTKTEAGGDVRAALEEFFYSETKRRPMVIPVIIE
ncbi:MAG: ribonuclease J [Anaerolineae bacterium]|jgi:ribonuclease J|nr:ribonuclease J [Anaerolineae bacterium]MDH7472440.1 ribonuclease J [Anaerolineae bacterium]